MSEWKDKSHPIVVPEFVDEAAQPNTCILDVRKPGEWKDGVAENAVLLELNDVWNHVLIFLFSLKS